LTGPGAGYGTEVEGFHAVAAAVAAGRVRLLTVEASRLRHGDYRKLVDEAEATGATVRRVEDTRSLAATGAPQGVVATCTPIPYLALADVVPMADPAVLLALDHIQDPRNLGALARAALAAGVPAIATPVRRAAPVGATAFKAAAGALEHVAVASINSVGDALARLRKAGVWTVGLDGSAERSIFELDLLTEPVAIVLGAEGQGVSRLVAERLDVTARIPMRPGVESLNAAVAGAIAMFEVARKRGWIS
jgi:23S rRNA (guanosine2251-2'-O)-methyltransferase